MESKFGVFFKGKTVLITGHTGFIGSWLSIWLNDLGANVIGYALPPLSEKDNFAVTKLEEKIEHIIGDVRDYGKLEQVFKEHQPDIIYHLAAQPIVRKSYSVPKETYDTNVGGTVNVFEAFRQINDSKILINFTTDKCYENKESTKGYKETDRLGGYDPYSSSKACSELITLAYRDSFFTNSLKKDNKSVSSVRCGNIIGGGDWQEDRLIPECMRSILEEKEIIIRNPDSVRPWQHVLEPIRGLLMLTQKMWEGDPSISSAWNFGPKENLNFTVKDVVEKIVKYMGKGSYSSLTKQESDLHETKLLMLNINKAKVELGWKPEVSMDETIALLCDWYIEEKVDYDFDIKQINEYIKKITQ